MKTYAITYMTNYGEIVAVIRAKSEEALRAICKDHDYIWEDNINDIIELTDNEPEGVILIAGGDC